MPLFNISLKKQEQAAASGISLYPEATTCIKNRIIGDSFNRNTLLPTDWPTIYSTTLGTADGTISFRTVGTLRVTSGDTPPGATLLWLKEIRFSLSPRVPYNEGAISKLTFYLPYNQILNSPTSKGFIGLLGDTLTELAAIPTTERHIGIYWNTAVDSNIYLSSGNGSTQSTTDSSFNVGNGARTVIITMTGANAATVQLTDGTTTGTHTVTSYGASVSSLNWYVETTLNPNKVSIDLDSWSVEAV